MTSTRTPLWLLALCQGLLLTNNSALSAINGLAGKLLAPDPRLATLPITFYVLGGALSTLPISLLMQRRGRKFGFAVGCLFALAGALLTTWSMQHDHFWLLCLGTMLFGAFNASGQYFRFAATDGLEPGAHAKAISNVLSGGLIGAFCGPFLSAHTQHLAQIPFVGTYISLTAIAILSFLLTRGICDGFRPSTATTPAKITPQQRAEIWRNPVFILAVASSAVGWALMNLLMSATPLAMENCGYPFSDAAFVLQWHMLGMYAPMLIAGTIVHRLGAVNCIAAGFGLFLVGAAIGVHGQSVTHFTLELACIGIAWSLLFVAGSSLLGTCYTPATRGWAQGINDSALFGSMTISSFSAGMLVSSAGWHHMQWIALAVISVCALGLYFVHKRVRLIPALVKPS
jgi:MFS family permease